MRHPHWTLLVLPLVYIPLSGQTNAHEALHAAVSFENRGDFEQAATTAKIAVDSGSLSGAELARGYVVLGVAYQGAGKITEAQVAFEHSLRILEPDKDHVEDYAAALQNYGEFYAEMGQLEAAGVMWMKAFRLGQEIGNALQMTVSLIRLSEMAMAQQQVRKARKYFKRASDEASFAPDLTDEDRALLFETEGWVELTRHHAREAIFCYQHALDLVERSHGGQHWRAGWGYMLLGKAYGQSGDLNTALRDMRKGLAILEHSLSRNNPKYLVAQIAYSQVLGRTGSHAEAAEMCARAEKALKNYYGSQCAGCTISVAAFR
jgi:tetratricopeptide (TPR) repeat protein